MEDVQNRLSLCSVVVPQLAQNQKEEGCVSRLLGELPNQIFLSTGDGSVSRILHLALNSAGVRGVPNAGELSQRGVTVEGWGQTWASGCVCWGLVLVRRQICEHQLHLSLRWWYTLEFKGGCSSPTLFPLASCHAFLSCIPLFLCFQEKPWLTLKNYLI